MKTTRHDSFAAYVLPSVLAFALSGLYTIVDGFFIGQSLGDLGLAAITLAYPAAALLQAVGTGIGLAGAIRCTILQARGEEQTPRTCFSGTVLLLLGFRALRRENPWLRGCFVCAVLRAACVFPSLILNTTILPGDAYKSAAAAVSAALMLALLLCFWQGLRAVRRKAGLPAQGGGAGALLAWYVLMCVLAAVHYTGLLVPIAMLVGYVCILRSLFRLSGALDEAGYAIAPQPVRVTDRCIALVLAAALGIGCTLGYLFGGSYRMDWQPADTSAQTQTAAIRQQLLDLGFPEATTSHRRTSPPVTARCASWP